MSHARLEISCLFGTFYLSWRIVQSIYTQKRVNLKQIAIVIMMAVLVNMSTLPEKSPQKSMWWNIVIFDDTDKWSKVTAGHFLA